MDKEEKAERINFTLDKALYNRIWKTLNSYPRADFESKSDFIRKLIELGLAEMIKTRNIENE